MSYRSALTAKEKEEKKNKTVGMLLLYLDIPSAAGWTRSPPGVFSGLCGFMVL